MPMKISGMLKFRKLMCDILRIDFENDFKLVEQTENIVILEKRKNKQFPIIMQSCKSGDAFDNFTR